MRRYSTGLKADVAGLAKSTARSRVTNGADLLATVDHRSLWARQFRDLCHLHIADLGGPDLVSKSEKALVRRCAALNVELERMEFQFAEAGASTLPELETFQRTSNSLRRILQTLGLKRRPRDVTMTLQEYWNPDDGAEVQP